jgi:hypothetical protein
MLLFDPLAACESISESDCQQAIKDEAKTIQFPPVRRRYNTREYEGLGGKGVAM